MVESVDQDWYCMVGGSSSGPFSLTELKFLVTRGQVKADSLVRQGKTAQWVPAGSVESLIDPGKHSSHKKASSGTRPAAAAPKRAAKPAAEGTSESQPAAKPVASPPSLPPPVNSSKKRNQVITGGLAGAAIAGIVVLLLIMLLRPDAIRIPAHSQVTDARGGPVTQPPVDSRPTQQTPPVEQEPETQAEPEQPPGAPTEDELAREVADIGDVGGEEDFEDDQTEASTEDVSEESAASRQAGSRPQISLGQFAEQAEEQDEPSIDAGRFSRRDTKRPRTRTRRSGKESQSALPRKGRVKFFGIGAKGRSFIFVVDSSGSMTGVRFLRAVEELKSSIHQLKSNQKFFIVFYNNSTHMLFSQPPPQSMVRGTRQMKTRAIEWVQTQHATGGTLPQEALRGSLLLQPDVIFLLTDGEIPPDTRAIASQFNTDNTVIHTICFGSRAGEVILKAIADDNGGLYRFVN